MLPKRDREDEEPALPPLLPGTAELVGVDDDDGVFRPDEPEWRIGIAVSLKFNKIEFYINFRRILQNYLIVF